MTLVTAAAAAAVHLTGAFFFGGGRRLADRPDVGHADLRTAGLDGRRRGDRAEFNEFSVAVYRVRQDIIKNGTVAFFAQMDPVPGKG